MSFPCGIAVDGSGNLVIADSGNNRVRKVSADAVITTVAALPFSPRSMAVNADGELYVEDQTSAAIFVLKPTTGGS